MSKRILYRLLTLSLILCMTGVVDSQLYAQKKRKPAKSAKKPPKNPEDAAKMEANKDKEIDKKIRDKRKEYKKSLSKSDRKRMKRNRKKSDRHGRNKKDPFLNRVFSRKNKRGKKIK